MGVELLLVGSGELLAGLGGRDGVLGDGEPAPNRVLAQRDVVILRAREVLEQVAVRLRRHDAKVEPEALVGDHGRLRVALRDDVGDVLACREVVDQRRRVGRRRDHVEVAERLPATARGARLRHLHGRRVRAELLDELEQHRQAAAEQPPRLTRVLGLLLPERLQDLLLALRAEPRQRAQPLLLGRFLQLGERGDAELLPDPPCRLRPEARQAHELDDLLRHELLALGQRLHLAELDDLDDLVLDRLADSREALGLPVERELRDRPAGLPDPRRRPAVGEHPEGVLSLELAQVGQQLQLVGEHVVPRQCGSHR